MLTNTLKLKDTGSLQNFIYGNNNTKPVVGKGCTICHWTDSHAYEVVEVINEKRIKIQRYKAKRSDKNGMSDAQTYIYDELKGEPLTLVYRYRSWQYEKNDNNKTVYHKMPGSIIFGVKNEYYDYSF